MKSENRKQIGDWLRAGDRTIEVNPGRLRSEVLARRTRRARMRHRVNMGLLVAGTFLLPFGFREMRLRWENRTEHHIAVSEKVDENATHVPEPTTSQTDSDPVPVQRPLPDFTPSDAIAEEQKLRQLERELAELREIQRQQKLVLLKETVSRTLFSETTFATPGY